METPTASQVNARVERRGKEEVEFLIYEPQPGFQVDFLQAGEKEV